MLDRTKDIPRRPIPAAFATRGWRNVTRGQNGYMNLRLVSLKDTGPDTCLAELESDRDDHPVYAEFRVTEQNGISTASPTPDVFVDFRGSADELRQIVAAVLAFNRAARPLE